MTSPYVLAPAPKREWWRMALSVLVVVAGIAGAGIAGIIAAITWTGCFIACTGENHLGGALLGLLAALSLASGPAAVSGLYRSGAWMRAAVGVFGMGAFGILVVLGSA